jgi:uncharacterized protein
MNHLSPDVGDGSVCASFAADGSWLSVGTTDPDVGFVELSGMPPFPDDSRGDVAAVRAYRLLMEDASSAFLRVHGAVPIQRAASSGTVTQTYAVHGAGPVVVEFAGHLDRPAYAEVTDVSPLPAIDLGSRASIDGNRLRLCSTAGVGARIDVEPAAVAAVLWVAASPNTATIELPGESTGGFTVTVAVGRDTVAPAAAAKSGTLVDGVASNWLVVPDRHRATVFGIAGAALRYSLGCTVLTAGDGFRTILTDHRILPLSWTRDAYYQARALLAAGVADDSIGAHLRWLWLCCDRPDHLWQRSHQANGQVKDVAVQADQQLYPILELLDHRDVLGRWPPPEAPAEWGRLVTATWDALPRSDATCMLRSEENPADDPADLPLLLSTEVLHWTAARRLAAHAVELGLERRAAELVAEAAAVRSAVARGFAVDGPFGTQWAYAIDACGGQRLYHDANDLPVALAPLVGFVAPDDKAWQATMRFAFSPHNPAFVPGRGGGLGSLHTPGVWPLGDVQEWVWASIAGDDRRVDRVLSRLAAVHRHGMLPEAYDPASAEWRSRRWFAWPGAAIAAIVAGAYG